MRQGSRCQEAPGPDEVQHHLPAAWPTSFSAPAAVRAGRGDRVSVTVDHRPVCWGCGTRAARLSRLRAIPMASNSPFCNRCVTCFPGFGGPPGRRLSRLMDLFLCDDRYSIPAGDGCLLQSLQIFWASRRQGGPSYALTASWPARMYRQRASFNQGFVHTTCAVLAGTSPTAAFDLARDSIGTRFSTRWSTRAATSSIRRTCTTRAWSRRSAAAGTPAAVPDRVVVATKGRFITEGVQFGLVSRPASQISTAAWCVVRSQAGGGLRWLNGLREISGACVSLGEAPSS
jgi:hypothetical protein